MPPQSHDQMIQDFAKLAGALSGNTTKPNKWKLIARRVAFEAIKLAAALGIVLVLTLVGFVFLGALHEVGLISWSVTLWQAIRLIGPVLLFVICVPLTLTVKLRMK